MGRRSQPGYIVVAVCLFLSAVMPRVTHAGTLTTLRDYLRRQTANMVGAEKHHFFFTPATSLAGTENNLKITFPDTQDGTWCATASTDLVLAGISDPPGVTENATPLPGGIMTAGCTSGSGVGSYDTLTISNVGPLTGGTKYGFSVTDGAIGRLGTPGPAAGIMVTLKTNDGAVDVDTGILYLAIIGTDQVSVSARVVDTSGQPPNPVVEFRGLAAPGASVRIGRDGTTLQTITADVAAVFDVTLTAQPVGAQLYELTATDSDLRDLAPMTFALNLTLGSTTLISGVFLGPSIGINSTAVKIGVPVTIFGKTAPNSSVNLTVNSVRASSFSVTADDQGYWEKIVPTTPLGVGSHSAQARAVASGATISEMSSSVTFAVNPLATCDEKSTADLNCDGRVNLTDFSVLLFFWKETAPSNTRADINHDGQVNITDFSIMLFQWNG